VAEELSRIRSAVYVVICTGRFDLFVDVVTQDYTDLLNCLDDEIRPVPGVARVEAWVHLEAHWRPLRPPSTASTR
jgi:Lrp/AsnC family transcriptional regulator, regulator for asnA, asnC and gidA